MRASRLISLLLLLQARGRMTADALAAELEVSVRTIYRDIEALHSAGVALYGEPGHAGGYQLVGGYRTQLTGLTREEASALPLHALPGAARDLGIGSAAAGAAAKLTAALSDDLRRRADHVQARLYVDPAAWYDEPDSTPHLATVADALWQHRRLRIGYERWQSPSGVDRTVDPFGLVLKAGRWYLVARAGEQLRTYRVSNLTRAELLDDGFDRPDDFELAAHWHAYLAEFTTRRHRQRATVRLSPTGLDRLRHLMEPAVVRSVESSAGRPDADGWLKATLPIESLRHAHEELLRLGGEVEVLTPAALRDLFAGTAAALVARYS